MVMKTMSDHVALLKLGENKGVKGLVSTKPGGALMMSIQAVHEFIFNSFNATDAVTDQVLRALMYTRSGEIVELSGKEGSFSKDNWGDYLVKGAGGASDKLVRQSTYFKAKIVRMLEKQ